MHRTMAEPDSITPNVPTDSASRIWAVGALCLAVADALQARFNPVAVRGEITGFRARPAGIATSR